MAYLANIRSVRVYSYASGYAVRHSSALTYKEMLKLAFVRKSQNYSRIGLDLLSLESVMRWLLV